MTEAELDQLELKARTTIPEYGRIFTQCQSEMGLFIHSIIFYELY